MKILKVIGVILVILIGGYLVAAIVAPSSLMVERSIVVDAPASQVYPIVVCFENWEQWNPWDAMDPTNSNEYSEGKCSVGSWYSWKGDNTGEGKQTLVEARVNEYLKTSLVFSDAPEPQTSEWFFEATEEGTKVTWNFVGTETSFFNRPTNLMGEYFISVAYESGLAALKEVAESSPVVEEPAFDVNEVDFPESSYLLMSGDVMTEDMAEFYSSSFGKIMAYMGIKGVEMNGYPTGIYYEWLDTMAKMSAAVPVGAEVEETEEIEFRVLDGARALEIDYYGSYEGLGGPHMAIEQYWEANGVSLAGFAIETYVTDPGEEPDTSKWLTKITYPIASE